MDHFRHIKIQNGIKQKNVIFIAEPQDNLVFSYFPKPRESEDTKVSLRSHYFMCFLYRITVHKTFSQFFFY